MIIESVDTRKKNNPLETSLIQAQMTHPAQQREMAEYGYDLILVKALKLNIV